MSTTACIIQARLGSTRLPAKVLLPLPTGRTVLEEVIHRCRQIKGVDVVVVAVADDAGSDIVAQNAEFAARGAPSAYNDSLPPVRVVRGPERDVLKRYVMAAEEVKADIIMRVTADCPLVDPEVCAEVLSQLKNDGLDYCSNVHPRTFPKGFDVECLTMETLKRVDQLATSDDCREHVTLYVYTTEGFKRDNYQQNVDRSHVRLTLDILEDYRTIWNEFEIRRAIRSTSLIDVAEHAFAERILWDILEARPPEFSISHKAMPPWEDHCEFVRNHPYEAFYLIVVDGRPVGKIYLTFPPAAPSLPGNEIGIDLFPDAAGKGYGPAAVKLLMEKHSERRYVANISPNNERSRRMFQRLGFAHVQDTFALG